MSIKESINSNIFLLQYRQYILVDQISQHRVNLNFLLHAVYSISTDANETVQLFAFYAFNIGILFY